MHSRDIRERFLHFFEDRGHQRLSSSPLVPRDDPALLFTVAGMIPLKQYFVGARTPPAPSVTSCQKCFRMDDIEEVGRTPRHETFFEMLGNFSFGAYFKEGAIPLAWELLTHDLGLPAERLWPSVHPRDDLALELWTRAGVPERRVARLEDNFWEMGKGLPGPCGFDSEIHWDLGAPCSCGRTDCLPGCDGDRWVELWNLVFMEFDRDASGQMRPLPRPCIDTGMGLERLACVLQGKTSIFDTDLFAPLTAGLERRSALDPGERERLVSLRVCADHLRGSVFLI
ncbi:MAG TPA: alanine--tRNA ligase-related protein, partial [Candidatus Sulfotelmatobacter sp.]|nr:alanine--tRNA ligase-related protein [Candidatus Sulfotelmatobacter sp.]